MLGMAKARGLLTKLAQSVGVGMLALCVLQPVLAGEADVGRDQLSVRSLRGDLPIIQLSELQEGGVVYTRHGGHIILNFDTDDIFKRSTANIIPGVEEGASFHDVVKFINSKNPRKIEMSVVELRIIESNDEINWWNALAKRRAAAIMDVFTDNGVSSRLFLSNSVVQNARLSGELPAGGLRIDITCNGICK